MERKQFEKNWDQLKNEIQQHWNKLTPDDIYQIDGMFDHCVGCLVKRYGWSKENAEKEIENWKPQMRDNTSKKPGTSHTFQSELEKPTHPHGRKGGAHEFSAGQENPSANEWDQQNKSKKRKAG